MALHNESVSDFDHEQWVTAEDLHLPDSVTSTPEQREDAAKMTAALLWAMSGRQFGVRDYVSRPIALTECGCGVPYTGCSATRRSFTFPVPVTIDGDHEFIVKIDGAALVANTDYRLVNHRVLYRHEYLWPCCQDLSLPDTEAGTFSVQWSGGVPVDDGGRMSARAFGGEIVKWIVNDPSCRLPERIQSMSRQGIDFTFVDSLDFLDKMRTGITLVDLWLQSVNPDGRRVRRARIFNPDTVSSPSSI